MSKNFSYVVLISMVPILSGCSAIEIIFKAGMWWALILVFLVVGLILWIFSVQEKNREPLLINS